MEVIMQARNKTIAELIDQCARGELPFDGDDSLYSKVRAMGFNGNSLYEMVRAAENRLADELRTEEALSHEEAALIEAMHRA